jgi:hypothetical protein
MSYWKTTERLTPWSRVVLEKVIFVRRNRRTGEN